MTTSTTATVPRFAAPYDEDALADAVRNRGAAVVEGAFAPGTCDEFLTQVDDHLRAHPEEVDRAARSVLGYFQGETTASLHGLVGTIPAAAGMVLQPQLLGCARRLLAPLSDSVLLTTSEYMARNPGAPRQELHCDTFSWRHVPGGPEPVALTVMAAMSDFTAENGATWVVLDSHGGPPTAPAPDWDRAVQARMRRGDALIFRADLFHAGGANTTSDVPRRIFSTGYQVAWLRTVENPFLSTPLDAVAAYDPQLQELLGFTNELVLGLYRGGDPRNALPGSPTRPGPGPSAAGP